jgi:hypothetical protein
MDTRAAGQYMDNLYGKNQGFVAVAYKDKNDGWQESQFEWPKDRSKLIGWAKVHHDANLFICPALRNSNTARLKGDGTALQWLWADVDMDKVPAERQKEVLDRIDRLGSLVIASGTGNNRHVYVKLDTIVTAGEHYRLNTGLRNYLYADAKHPDNSLLRLPGSTNWKTDAGSPVKALGGRGTNGKGSMTVAELMKIRTFALVKNTGGVSPGEQIPWTPADVEGLPRRLIRMVNMPSDEAVARYGSRHKAVWAITGELHKRGLSADQIHTLMDRFPPAVEKNNDEHNGYDVHRDVAKRIIWDEKNDPLLAEPGDEDDAFEIATEEDDLIEFERRINELAQREYERSMARQRAREIEAERRWVAPPVDASWSLTDVLKAPPAPAQFLIGPAKDGKRGLCGVKHNVVITAQYKTGKTKFVIASIAKALADGKDFLDAAPVHTPAGGVIVGHWNCEMDPDEMASEYVIPAQFDNPHNMVGANLRGHRVNLLSAQGKAWAVSWLRDRGVKVWTIDSLARLARMAGVSEKDNDEMFDLLMALDEVKLEAGVDVIFLITHTGRAQMEEGKERARGATAIDDWADARWIMTDEGGTRFLAVDGRGVGMDASPLVYDETTGSSVLGFGGREEVKADGAVQTVVRVVKDQPGLTQKALQAVLKGSGMSVRATLQYIEDAKDAGLVEVKEESLGRGRPAKRHYLVGMEKPSGDRARRATPAIVDMRAAVRRRRRE